MDRHVEDYDETQLTDKIKKTAMLATKLTQIQLFFRTRKGDVIAMKGYVTNGQPIALALFGGSYRQRQHMSRQLFEDKDPLMI